VSDSAGLALRLATAADDAALRALTAAVAMPGAVSVRFAREPNYFLADPTLGDPCQVLVAERCSDGRILGVVCRAERRVYLAGRPTRVTYLGHLRIDPLARGRGLLGRGARWLRAHAEAGELSLGVIAAANPRAAGALMGRRPPAGARLARIASLTTYALLVGRVRPARVAGLRTAAARLADYPAVLKFWEREGARRDGFPVTDPGDLGGPALRGLAADDLLLVWRGGRIVGSLAVWDQRAYKQEIVDAFSPRLARLRPLYNLLARAIGARPLTPVGEAIALACAARVCVAGDDPRVLRSLLQAGLARAGEQGQAFLMLGLASTDPLVPAVQRFWHVAYRSNLVALAWDHDPAGRFSGRPSYVEIASL
jgi:hypothetical protein